MRFGKLFGLRALVASPGRGVVVTAAGGLVESADAARSVQTVDEWPVRA